MKDVSNIPFNLIETPNKAMKPHLESRAAVVIAPIFYRALFLGSLSRRYAAFLTYHIYYIYYIWYVENL